MNHKYEVTMPNGTHPEPPYRDVQLYDENEHIGGIGARSSGWNARDTKIQIHPRSYAPGIHSDMFFYVSVEAAEDIVTMLQAAIADEKDRLEKARQEETIAEAGRRWITNG